MYEEMKGAGQRGLSDRAVGPVSKAYSPAKHTLGTMTGVAEMFEVSSEDAPARPTTMDPLAHKIIGKESEGFDREAYFAAQRAALNKQNAFGFEVGAKVYHREKRKEYTVVEVIDDKHLMLKSSSGKLRKARIENLVKL